MSRVMRQHVFCICESKRADQLCGNPLFSKSVTSTHLAIFGCTARFVSDLVGNPGDRFSPRPV